MMEDGPRWWINGKNPLQYGFDFGLWTRQIVRELVEREFGVRLSLASIGGMLARLGLSAQKPLQRAYQRDPEAPALVRSFFKHPDVADISDL
ncbi:MULTISPECIES: helix-turn-helix domain-containing protein [unclassified Bradyrhizobium]